MDICGLDNYGSEPFITIDMDCYRTIINIIGCKLILYQLQLYLSVDHPVMYY